MEWHVYILLCADDSCYAGHTRDLQQRVETHNAGQGAAHTACRLPVTLVYSESFPTEEQAIAREAQRKKWSRAKKVALIAGDTTALKMLSQSRD